MKLEPTFLRQGLPVAWLAKAALVCALVPAPAMAAGPDDAKGLWRNAEGSAVIEFKPCGDKASALCGHIGGMLCCLLVLDARRTKKGGESV